MLYDLSKALDRKRFVARVKHLWDRPFGEKKLMVELKEVKGKRSLSTNNYMHLLFEIFSIETGHTPAEVKEDIFKRIVNKDVFLHRNQKTGFTVCRSSADLKQDEANLCIERFRNWSSSELGIYLPLPNEEELLRQAEEEVARARQYFY